MVNIFIVRADGGGAAEQVLGRRSRECWMGSFFVFSLSSFLLARPPSFFYLFFLPIGYVCVGDRTHTHNTTINTTGGLKKRFHAPCGSSNKRGKHVPEQEKNTIDFVQQVSPSGTTTTTRKAARATGWDIVIYNTSDII